MLLSQQYYWENATKCKRKKKSNNFDYFGAQFSQLAVAQK